MRGAGAAAAALRAALAGTLAGAALAGVALAGAALAGAAPDAEPPDAPAEAREREPVVGLPCEGCDAVFAGMPRDIASAARIAPAEEPGEPLRIEGRVVHADGSPAPGTIVYAYQTNAAGIYPTRENMPAGSRRHGTLRGWARADAEGRYRFDSIRPGGYPGTQIPQHIHLHVIEPGRCTYYIDDLFFTDDPRMTPERIPRYVGGRGGSGLVTPVRQADGTWTAERDIVLGESIPGYPPAAP